MSFRYAPNYALEQSWEYWTVSRSWPQRWPGWLGSLWEANRLSVIQVEKDFVFLSFGWTATSSWPRANHNNRIDDCCCCPTQMSCNETNQTNERERKKYVCCIQRRTNKQTGNKICELRVRCFCFVGFRRHCRRHRAVMFIQRSLDILQSKAFDAFCAKHNGRFRCTFAFNVD